MRLQIFLAFGLMLFPLASTYSIEQHKDLSFSRQEIHLLPELRIKKTTPEERIIFLHIPKTAGTNLDNIAQVISRIEGKFRYQRLPVPRVPKRSPNLITSDWIGGWKRLEEQPHLLDALPDRFFLTGHFPYGLHAHFNMPCKYVTLIRNPLERELSDANFAYQRGYLGSEEFESYLMDRMIDNPQVRLVAGREYLKNSCTEETLAKAIENIEREFLLAAPMEEVDVFIQVLASNQGWGSVAYAPMQITGIKVVEKVDPLLADRLREKHQWDLKFYEWIKARWNVYKEKTILGTQELAPEDRVLTLMPDHLTTREPRFLTVLEIATYNLAHKSEELLELEQSSLKPPRF